MTVTLRILAPMSRPRFHRQRQIVRSRDGGVGFKFWAPERVVEKQTGCWNCLHFDNGPLAKQHFVTLRTGALSAAIDRAQKADPTITMQGALLQAEHFIASQVDPMSPPKTGICLKAQTGTDLVHPAYMCAKWTGRIAPEGKVDELIQDVKAALDEE